MGNHKSKVITNPDDNNFDYEKSLAIERRVSDDSSMSSQVVDRIHRARQSSDVLLEISKPTKIKKTSHLPNILPTIEEVDYSKIDEKNTEIKLKQDVMITLQKYIPRYQHVRKAFIKLKINRNNIEHVKLENSYLFYNILPIGHVEIFDLIIKIQSLGLPFNNIIKYINKLLIGICTHNQSLSGNEKLDILIELACISEINDFIKFLSDWNSKNDEDSEIELIDELLKEETKYDWFISHNGNDKKALIDAFSGRNVFIDKLCFESELNNRRWLISAMCASKGMILYVNNQFIKSKWCLWELSVAKMIQSRNNSFKIFPIVSEGQFKDYQIISQYPGKIISEENDLLSIIEGLYQGFKPSADVKDNKIEIECEQKLLKLKEKCEDNERKLLERISKLESENISVRGSKQISLKEHVLLMNKYVLMNDVDRMNEVNRLINEL